MEANDKILIALLKEPRDFNILRNKGWYRIPVRTKICPKMVKDRSVKYIGFYMGNNFGELLKFKVSYYGKVESIEIQTREELFPNEISEKDPQKEYFKIKISDLQSLQSPILNKTGRRITFLKSNTEKFFHATDINEAIHGSPIEEKVWNELKKNNITAQREELVNVSKDKVYYLDFAIHCKQRNIDVECDGDSYHLKSRDVKLDKKRDRLLTTKGWSVLRYTTSEIENEMPHVLEQVNETIEKYGGYKTYNNTHKYVSEDNQDRLFD